MSTSTFSETLCPFEPSPEASYSIDLVAHLTGVPRHRIAVYCRSGLVGTLGDPARDGWRFGPRGIRDLRRVERIRERIGENLVAIRMILALLDEVDDLRQQLDEARQRRW